MWGDPPVWTALEIGFSVDEFSFSGVGFSWESVLICSDKGSFSHDGATVMLARGLGEIFKGEGVEMFLDFAKGEPPVRTALAGEF